MTKETALMLLASANMSEANSRINSSVPQTAAVEIVRRAVENLYVGEHISEIPDWLEKRVLQVSQNRIRPSELDHIIPQRSLETWELEALNEFTNKELKKS